MRGKPIKVTFKIRRNSLCTDSVFSAGIKGHAAAVCKAVGKTEYSTSAGISVMTVLLFCSITSVWKGVLVLYINREIVIVTVFFNKYIQII